MDRRRLERDLANVISEMDNVRSNRSFIVIEILIIAALIGFYFQSWTALFVSAIVLAVLFVIPLLRTLIFFVLSIIWGIAAYLLLPMFVSGDLAIGGGVIVFILVFLIHRGA